MRGESCVCMHMGGARKMMKDSFSGRTFIISSSLLQLLPGMVNALFTTIFSSFSLFRTIYNRDSSGVLTALLNMLWTFYLIPFLATAIYYADTTTKAVRRGEAGLACARTNDPKTQFSY
jgi:hypothetical protein